MVISINNELSTQSFEVSFTNYKLGTYFHCQEQCEDFQKLFIANLYEAVIDLSDTFGASWKPDV